MEEILQNEIIRLTLLEVITIVVLSMIGGLFMASVITRGGRDIDL